MNTRQMTAMLGVTLCSFVLLAGGSAVAAKDETKKAPEKKAEKYKIGVVDIQLLLAESKERKAKYDALQGEVDKLQTDIDAMSVKIDKMKADYEEKRDGMADEERFDLKNKIEEEYAVYRSELEKRQRLIDSKEERVLVQILKEIDETLTAIAEEEDYHLILNAKGGPRSAVLYHSPTIDITSKVLVRMNKP